MHKEPMDSHRIVLQLVPGAFGSLKLTQKAGACVEHHFWHLGMAGRSDHVAQMVCAPDGPRLD
jgi:hypothetical protein